ncbi:MAG: hypothetical protein CML30_13765 [Rhizobiales bacterium]|nr:hypothetical protein [Hyphomicrobiales bacterium]
MPVSHLVILVLGEMARRKTAGAGYWRGSGGKFGAKRCHLRNRLQAHRVPGGMRSDCRRKKMVGAAGFEPTTP